jgi:peroxiredoxin
MSNIRQPKNYLIKSALGFCLLLALAGVFYKVILDKPTAPRVTFTDLRGEKIQLNQWLGKVVMLNFWATTCTTCVAEMPEMIATYKKYHDKGLEFVAIAMSYDQPNLVVNFAETRQLPFHVSLDLQGESAMAFGKVQLTPTTFVIDKQGRIIKRYVGQPSFNELHALLDKELSKI